MSQIVKAAGVKSLPHEHGTARSRRWLTARGSLCVGQRLRGGEALTLSSPFLSTHPFFARFSLLQRAFFSRSHLSAKAGIVDDVSTQMKEAMKSKARCRPSAAQLPAASPCSSSPQEHFPPVRSSLLQNTERLAALRNMRAAFLTMMKEVRLTATFALRFLNAAVCCYL